MKTIKYPIKEVNIGEIPNNKLLGIGISRNQRDLCRKAIESYGLLMPIVAVEKPGGPMTVLKGDKELTVLKDMSVQKADVFVATMKNKDDVGKVILLLASLNKEMNHISEGLILKEIIDSGNYNQKSLSAQLAKSESWISKRLSLAQRLSDSVTAMVMQNELGPSVAQNIARIPKNRQHEFAMNIRRQGIPKVQVEKLVSSYLSEDTSESFRDTIIGNPSLASGFIREIAARKVAAKPDAAAKFEGALRLLLRLIAELEVFFAKLEQNQISKHSALIGAVKSSAAGLIALIGSVSPGKLTEERTGAGNDKD